MILQTPLLYANGIKAPVNVLQKQPLEVFLEISQGLQLY